MVTAISARRRRPGLGLGAGLTAAARGLAFVGLMLAGLGLLLAVLAVLGLIALSVVLLLQDQRGPHDQRALVLLLVVLAAALACGRFYGSAWLAGLRRLAIVTRRLAGEWCGVTIADPYQPAPGPSGSRLSFTARISWLTSDVATWRDLLWVVVNIVVGWVLAAAAAVLIAVGIVASGTCTTARRPGWSPWA